MPWDMKQWGSEVTGFLAEIGKGGEARVLRDLKRMSSDGHLFRGHTRSLGDGIFELKVAYQGMAYRLLYVHHERTAVFLVCFEKKTQKTPKNRIEMAKHRYALLLRQEVAFGSIKFN